MPLIVPADGVYAFAFSDQGHDDFGNVGGRYCFRFRRLPEPSAPRLALAALAALGLVAVLARRLRAPATASSAES